ncbi:MucR family transcriptional regulator [Methylobacterium sp. J-076]|uniref:MucR family transcriptional regulator n=1 Tax=Methylobacterium sp. J-076 TaxID=2836655 RepID=UPI001FBBA84A|nr:MucR family transcriptional regulator [Methylobacterium sp. J-076]MCJ2015191.1 MucR family transcriptional regulator [Methylobacterium sp. J-076]
MSQETETHGYDFIVAASEIVAAYVSHNHVAPADLPSLIASVHQAVAALTAGPVAAPEEPADKPNTAQVRKSVQHDGIVSFLDGRSYKTLKRHLSAHGLSPASYRQRFGLAADYPMVAPSYSEKRSSLAKSLGLGRPASGPAVSGNRKKAA